MVKCLIAGLIHTLCTEFRNDSRRGKRVSSAAVDFIKSHPVFYILTVFPETGLAESQEHIDYVP